MMRCAVLGALALCVTAQPAAVTFSGVTVNGTSKGSTPSLPVAPKVPQNLNLSYVAGNDGTAVVNFVPAATGDPAASFEGACLLSAPAASLLARAW